MHIVMIRGGRRSRFVACRLGWWPLGCAGLVISIGCLVGGGGGGDEARRR